MARLGADTTLAMHPRESMTTELAYAARAATDYRIPPQASKERAHVFDLLVHLGTS
jgi:hypothetical protein